MDEGDYGKIRERKIEVEKGKEKRKREKVLVVGGDTGGKGRKDRNRARK